MLKPSKVILSLAVLMILTALVITPVEAETDVRVGYVSLQEVAEAHPAVAKAQQQLQQQAMQMQQEFQQQAAEIGEEDQQQLQQLQQQFQQQIQQLQMEQEQALEAEVMPDIDLARKDLGYDIILSREAIVSGGEDITEEVIQYFRDSDDIEDLPEEDIMDLN